MESFRVNLAFIFFCITLVSAIDKPDPEAWRFSYKCLDNSVVVTFKQREPYEVHIYTVSSNEEKSGCARTFTLNEPAVKEIDFKSCTYAAKKFQVYVDEKYGRNVNQHYFPVDCKTREIPRGISFWDYLFSKLESDTRTYKMY